MSFEYLDDKKDTSYHVSVSQIELKNQKDDLELEDNKELVDEPEDLTKQTALHNRYSFWFHRRGQQLNKGGSYEESTVKLSSFQTVSVMIISVLICNLNKLLSLGRLSISGEYMITLFVQMTLKYLRIIICSKKA